MNDLFQVCNIITQDNWLSLIRVALMHLTLDNDSKMSLPSYRCFLKKTSRFSIVLCEMAKQSHILLLELYSAQLPFTLHSARLALFCF